MADGADEAKPEAEPEDEEVKQSLANSDVCTKYREAAKIVNLALQGLMQLCAPDKTVLELCNFGDQVIIQKCATIFRGKVNGKPIDKGVAFPTCVSVNECVCHTSPLASESQPPIAEGDMVKFDLGCYIDGYIATVAHTVIVGKQPSPEEPLTGTKADVLHAAHIAGEVALKLIKPGNTNQQVTRAISKVAEAFGVNCVAGALSHQMKRCARGGGGGGARKRPQPIPSLPFP